MLTDKGTFDAVGLTANAVENKKKYKQSVWKMLQPDGLLIVTSCNSTAQELQVIKALHEFEKEIY